MTEKSKQELDNLKAQWMADPIWDIENTEGFEKYKDQLYNWKIEQIGKSKKEWFEKIYKKSFELNCSYSLADYIIRLEDRIAELEEKLYGFMNRE